MATIIVSALAGGRIADELEAVAERVRASVVAVRGARHGGGAGVIWDANGLVITNAHVATGARAEVDLVGLGRFPAEVVARAPELDLAALRLVAPLPVAGWLPATIGDSTALRAGELVVAVGHPLGERNAVTLGMFGGNGRIHWEGQAQEALRLAITLRPGNSGGALADVQGRIVGVPNVVVGPGLALAVPAHVVERFLRRETRA